MFSLTVPSFLLKFSLVTILCIAVSFYAGAQGRGLINEIDAIEVSAGPGLVSLYHENISSDERQPKVGATIGISLLYLLGEKISLNPGLYYERKGLKSKYVVSYYDASKDTNDCKCTTSSGITENNLDLDYITFSVPLRFSFHSFHIQAGPFASYLLGTRQTSKNRWDNSVTHSNGSQSIKETDVGISVGVGYHIKISDNKFVNIQISDNYGLLNIGDRDVTQTIIKTNSLSLQLGLNIKL